MSQQIHQPPSVILRLNEWVENTYQMDGWWTCIQFDRAVTYLGGWVDNKLLERDEKGHAIYTLEQLLAEKDTSSAASFLELVGYNGELE